MIRAAVAIAAVAWCVAAAVLVSGGISFRLGGVLVRSHSPIPALVVAVVFSFAVALARRAERQAAVEWWWTVIEKRAAMAAAALAVAAVIIGLNWGTFVAGGSDSYCYLNQAELFARGEVHDFELFGADPEWPGTPGAFIPAGHSAVPSRPGAMAPICPAGYPVMLAAAELAFGRNAMFWVTPLMGGVLAWCTFVLGRRLGGGATGLLAALLVASSPIVLYQIVQPMNDVPAAALWCAVLVVVSRDRGGAERQSWFGGNARALWSGVLCGAALMIRPNLLPLAAVVGAWVTFGKGGLSVRSALLFAIAALPGAVFVLGAQAAMYGSPLRSGYGDLSALFAGSHVMPNLARYPRWVLEAHSPVLLLALVAPAILVDDKRRTAWWLLLFSAAVFGCYLPYVVFEDWWYQRFVLPALAPLFVLTAVPIVGFLARLPSGWRAIAFAAVCAAFAIVYVDRGVRRDAFRLKDFEYRFRAAGEYVATLPSNAAIVTGHQTGSVRFYSSRSAVGWGDIPPGHLADALDYLRRKDRKPYLLLESWEEPNFRARFSADPLGSLAWPPAVEIDRTVRIYNPDDYAKYMRGEFVPTERVVTRRNR